MSKKKIALRKTIQPVVNTTSKRPLKKTVEVIEKKIEVIEPVSTIEFSEVLILNEESNKQTTYKSTKKKLENKEV